MFRVLFILAILLPYIVASTDVPINDIHCNNIISGMELDQAMQYVSVTCAKLSTIDSKTLYILLNKCLQESKINSIPHIWNLIVEHYQVVPTLQARNIWWWFQRFSTDGFYSAVMDMPNDGSTLSMHYLENSIRHLLKIPDQQILHAAHYIQFAELFPSNQTAIVYHNVIETLLVSYASPIYLLRGICDLLLKSTRDENVRSVINEILLKISDDMHLWGQNIKDNTQISTDYPLYFDRFTDLEIEYGLLHPASFLWKEVERRNIGFQNEVKIKFNCRRAQVVLLFLQRQNLTFQNVRSRKGSKIYRITLPQSNGTEFATQR